MKPRHNLYSRSNRRGFKMIFARISSRDHDTDRFLIEPFESTVTLQIFQMASDRPVAGELLELLAGDQTRGQQPLHALAPHRPAFAFGKSLPQELKIRERLHGSYPL